jgi:hypothetical protein
VKPDLGAPGGGIMSTLPLEMGGYGEMSGSSMAAAHTAGAAALLIEAQQKASRRRHDDDNDDGGSSAAWVRAALMNTAEPRLWGEDPSYGLLDQVHRQGAGMLRVDRAVASLSGVGVMPPALALGESDGASKTRTLRIANDGRSRTTFDLSHEPALATMADTFMPSADLQPAAAVFSRNVVTVERGETAEVRVTVAEPAGLENRSIYGGYIVLTPRGSGPKLRVPYAGFKGDYQSIQASSAVEFAPGGPTYTMIGNNVPVLRIHLDHPVRRVRVQVADAKGKSQNFAVDADYLGRNAGPGEFVELPWNGRTFTIEDDGPRVGRSLKNGVYVLKVEVLKALGDGRNPAHVESWTLPPITIARP